MSRECVKCGAYISGGTICGTCQFWLLNERKLMQEQRQFFGGGSARTPSGGASWLPWLVVLGLVLYWLFR